MWLRHWSHLSGFNEAWVAAIADTPGCVLRNWTETGLPNTVLRRGGNKWAIGRAAGTDFMPASLIDIGNNVGRAGGDALSARLLIPYFFLTGIHLGASEIQIRVLRKTGCVEKCHCRYLLYNIFQHKTVMLGF